MSLFSSVLHGLQKKIDSQNSYKETVITCVRESLGITITPDTIVSLKDGVLILRLNAVMKMALQLKRHVLIQNLQDHGLTISTIR